jgi:hypothetical protein
MCQAITASATVLTNFPTSTVPATTSSITSNLASSSIASSPVDTSSRGLSTGAAVGIGVGCGVAAIAFLATLAFYTLAQRRVKLDLQQQQPGSPAGHDSRQDPLYYLSPSYAADPRYRDTQAPASELFAQDVVELLARDIHELPSKGASGREHR